MSNPISLRDAWRAGESTLGLWAGIANSSSAEILGRAGTSYVCVDAQHGLVDYQAAAAMFQAILLGGTCPIARVAWNEPGRIGKMLDAGAMGIIVPMVNTADEARAAVSACRYPPLGARSFGPSGVGQRDSAYFATSADQVAVIPMIETVEALANLDEILAVPGIDAIYVGPADLSISLALPPGNNDDSPVFVDALNTIATKAAAAGVVPGIHSSGALTPSRLAMGFRMITVAADTVALRAGIKAELARAAEASSTGSTDIY